MPNLSARFDEGLSSELVGAGSLLRQQVVDHRGRTLGRIEDLMFDADGGMVAYAVLAVAMREGESKRFAVPWHVLRVLPGGAGVTADLSREALVHSPGIPGVAGVRAQLRAEPVLLDRTQSEPLRCEGDRIW